MAPGAPRKYGEALTMKYLHAIAERIDARGAGANWDDFARMNPDLLAWPPLNSVNKPVETASS